MSASTSAKRKSSYYIGKRELKDYVRKSESPSLFIFLDLNKHLFYGHSFGTTEQLRDFWVKKFKNITSEQGVSHVEYKYWRRLFQLNKITAELTTAILYQYAFFVLTDNRNLVTLKKVADPILAGRFTSSTRNTVNFQLKKMSYQLLQKKKRSPAEDATLKLSLSNIVDLVDEEIFSIYDDYFDSTSLNSLLAVPVTDINLLDVYTREYIEAFTVAMADIAESYGRSTLVKLLYAMRLDLEGVKQDNVLLYQLVRIYIFVMEHMHYWFDHIYDTEDEHVFRIKGIMKVVLEDLDAVEIKSGERQSRASKQIKFFNNFQFSTGLNSTFYKNRLATTTTTEAVSSRDVPSSSPAITSTNINITPSPTIASSSSIASSTTATTSTEATQATDTTDATTNTSTLIITAATTNTTSTDYDNDNSNTVGKNVDISIYGSYDLEISLTEVKPCMERAKLQKQEGKCLHDNQTMYYNLQGLGLQQDYVIATTWGGMEGKMMKLLYVDNYATAQAQCDLVIPYHILLLRQFSETVLSFYEYKEFIRNTNEDIKLLFDSSITGSRLSMPHAISSPRR